VRGAASLMSTLGRPIGVGVNRGQSRTASGELLRLVRQRRGLTQPQLAHAIGCCVGSLARWESGNRTPNAPFRRLLALSLACPPLGDVWDGRPIDTHPEAAQAVWAWVEQNIPKRIAGPTPDRADPAPRAETTSRPATPHCDGPAVAHKRATP
jgi:transcriptional regulator with XRE-family HTH domain